MIDAGRDFKRELDKFRLQIRYAIMALLSERKVLLFNPTLIPLMQDLIQKNWNIKQSCSWCSFLLDKMHFELDPKERPFEDLREVFERVKLDLSNT